MPSPLAGSPAAMASSREHRVSKRLSLACQPGHPSKRRYIQYRSRKGELLIRCGALCDLPNLKRPHFNSMPDSGQGVRCDSKSTWIKKI